MMESIEKLREKSLNYAPNIRRDVNMALNEIEREIAEKYVLKPDHVSELLNSFLEEYDASMRPDEEIIAKYAVKIREAVSAG